MTQLVKFRTFSTLFWFRIITKELAGKKVWNFGKSELKNQAWTGCKDDQVAAQDHLSLVVRALSKRGDINKVTVYHHDEERQTPLNILTVCCPPSGLQRGSLLDSWPWGVNHHSTALLWGHTTAGHTCLDRYMAAPCHGRQDRPVWAVMVGSKLKPSRSEVPEEPHSV